MKKKPKYVKNMPKGVPKEQRWFWTERWQKMEREADEEIRKGKVTTFHSVEAALKYLESLHNTKSRSKTRSGRTRIMPLA